MRERAELVALLRAYLGPSLDRLPTIAAGGPEGREALAELRTAILNAVQFMCGPDSVDVRALLFRVDARTLVPAWRVGGTVNSERRFSKHARDKAGSEVWKHAAEGRPSLWRDLTVQVPAQYTAATGSNYQTFISCGIVTDSGDVRGMLNVDAPNPGDLTEVDADIVHVCAVILGVAETLADQAASVETKEGDGQRG